MMRAKYYCQDFPLANLASALQPASNREGDSVTSFGAVLDMLLEVDTLLL